MPRKHEKEGDRVYCRGSWHFYGVHGSGRYCPNCWERIDYESENLRRFFENIMSDEYVKTHGHNPAFV